MLLPLGALSVQNLRGPEAFIGRKSDVGRHGVHDWVRVTGILDGWCGNTPGWHGAIGSAPVL